MCDFSVLYSTGRIYRPFVVEKSISLSVDRQYWLMSSNKIPLLNHIENVGTYVAVQSPLFAQSGINQIKSERTYLKTIQI